MGNATANAVVVFRLTLRLPRCSRSALRYGTTENEQACVTKMGTWKVWVILTDVLQDLRRMSECLDVWFVEF